MTWNLALALITFSAITAFTPGPNNTLLMASGMNFGFRRSLPAVLGVCIGFPFMIACVGLGLGRIFDLLPWLYTALKYTGAAYMLWMAWKIAGSGPAGEGDVEAKPLRFTAMALFQWVNPKAWIMSITALSAYTVPEHYHIGVAAVVGAFLAMGLFSASTWALFGSALRHVMNDVRYYRLINYMLAVLLVASLVPIFWH
jgi:threonine/homoserine/homoserine lactone efflux protein